MRLIIESGEYSGGMRDDGTIGLTLNLKVQWRVGADKDQEYKAFMKIVKDIARGIRDKEQVELIVHDTRTHLPTIEHRMNYIGHPGDLFPG